MQDTVVEWNTSGQTYLWNISHDNQWSLFPALPMRSYRTAPSRQIATHGENTQTHLLLKFHINMTKTDSADGIYVSILWLPRITSP